LTSHHIVFSKHVGARLGKAGAVALVGASGKLALLGPHQPRDFVLGWLLAVWTVEGCRLLFLALVAKIAFFHFEVQAYIFDERSHRAPGEPPAIIAHFMRR